MSNILKSFLPWVVFFALCNHSSSSIEIATIAALASQVFFNYKTLKKGFVLDVGALLFFMLLALNVFVIKNQVITDNAYLISNCALAMIAWFSIIVLRPFTLQYARETVSIEIAHSKLFKVINYLLTGIWAILLSLMALPNIFEYYDPIKYASDIDIGISILLILIGVWVTNWLPEWLADKLMNKSLDINIQKQYESEKTPDKRYDNFNEGAISNTPDFKVQVIIVGAGPVGLTSGLLLQQHGIDVVIIEKHPDISIHPKARYISCRSMELYRKLGLEEAIAKHSLPKDQNFFCWLSSITGDEYARIAKQNSSGEISPTFEASAAQPFLERELLNQFVKNGGKIYFEHKAVNLAQNHEIVQLQVENCKTDNTMLLQADYLLAADGAHSTVREILGIPMIGPAEINSVFSAYCDVDLSDYIKADKKFSIGFILQSDKPARMALSVDGKNKWVFMFPSAGVSLEDLKKIYSDDYVKSQIEDLVGKDNLSINILSKNAWSLGSQIANQFKAGRTFLLGDAAHRFLPSGGMGMNSGLQDADNLIWKLAYVLNGNAKNELLNTYQCERVPPLLTAMQWSLENLKRIVHIQRQFAKASSEEDFSKLAKTQEAHLNKDGLDLGVIYCSDIVPQTSDKKPNIPTDRYIPNTFVGSRLPHFEIIKNNAAISSLDLVSVNHILLFKDEFVEHVQSLNFKNITTQLIPIDRLLKTFNDLLGEGNNAIWVRPDGHIAWKGDVMALSDCKKLEALITRMSASEV